MANPCLISAMPSQGLASRLGLTTLALIRHCGQATWSFPRRLLTSVKASDLVVLNLAHPPYAILRLFARIKHAYHKPPCRRQLLSQAKTPTSPPLTKGIALDNRVQTCRPICHAKPQRASQRATLITSKATPSSALLYGQIPIVTESVSVWSFHAFVTLNSIVEAATTSLTSVDDAKPSSKTVRNYLKRSSTTTTL